MQVQLPEKLNTIWVIRTLFLGHSFAGKITVLFEKVFKVFCGKKPVKVFIFF